MKLTPISKLRARMSPEARARSEDLARQMLDEMALRELREAYRLTQQQLAHALDTTQANISKIERRADMLLSTLDSYVEAMGGRLVIVIQMPSGPVALKRFRQLRGRGHRSEVRRRRHKDGRPQAAIARRL